MATVGLLVEVEGVLPARSAAARRVEVPAGGYAVGDYEVAFNHLYRRAYDVAYKLLGYRAEAEDVAQEALARAFVHWPRVHDYAEPWVVRVAGNLAIGSWRKNRRLRSLGDTELTGEVSGPGAERVELRRALGNLSRRQREVVVLRHLAGFSERETAAALGCSAGSVKQHGSRGLAALKEQLRLPDDTDPTTDDPDSDTGGR